MDLKDVNPPIVAILRGVQPDEVVDIAEALLEAGIRAIEVPLNSPAPLISVERLCAAFGDRALCGAGTVLSPGDVDDVAERGGRLIVTPNCDTAVIERAVARGLVVMPGFTSPTEAFAAVKAGAEALKLFPAGSYGPGHLKAIKDVLPARIACYAVGGVGADTMESWIAAGAAGFGIGGEIYRPGMTAETVKKRAETLVAAYIRAAAGK